MSAYLVVTDCTNGLGRDVSVVPAHLYCKKSAECTEISRMRSNFVLNTLNFSASSAHFLNNFSAFSVYFLHHNL